MDWFETIFIVFLLAAIGFLLFLVKNSLPFKMVGKVVGGGKGTTRMGSISDFFVRIGVIASIGLIVVVIAILGVFVVPVLEIPFTQDFVLDNLMLLVSIVIGIGLVFAYVIIRLTKRSTKSYYKKRFGSHDGGFKNSFEARKKKRRWKR